ncbi:MFS general substrate transporter [Hyphopichia burtonii NRRL Y-1933]|uniref:MFS general substrate transporter n=1 Tax=Hyphopichia burtonii NRRL Y-1933 TaxID=984485 RepID=A0A1E4RMI8_9ASCO|nr:MFS general substrate transporter [Hyphopichia burtonii NRRL Y-1933]ODV68456.1 MFS general substrate transporter [Hyphopichia burtonii NRRL Y-1933]
MQKYDQAFEFVNEEQTISSTDSVDSKVAYRKIDFRVCFILCGAYFLQFLDKSLLNYAAVMGIKTALTKPSQFNDLGTILYCAYIFGEPISAYCFQKFPVGKFFGICIICTGIVTICTGAVNSNSNGYASLMVLRALLGLFENSFASGCCLITSMWYSKTQQLHRTSWWTIQAGTSTMFGGLLSFLFQKIDSSKISVANWQLFYFVIGVITLLFGTYTFFSLPDNPTNCKFLTRLEKRIVLENIRLNQTGTESSFKPDKLKELLFKDKHTWPMVLLTLISMIPTGAVLTFSVSMIKNIGFNNQHSALMQIPLGVSTILAIVLGTNICAYFNGNHRSFIFISMLVPAIIGYIVLLSCSNKIGLLMSVYLINVGTCVITMIYSWNTANTANSTKRVYRNCITMIAFAVGCLIGPQIVVDYQTAYLVLMILSIVCIPLVLLVRYISIYENRKRDSLSKEEVDAWLTEMGDNYEFKDLTDIENIMFRYSY